MKKELQEMMEFEFWGSSWENLSEIETGCINDYTLKQYIFICAEKAYMDMCRTLSFHSELKRDNVKNRKEKARFRSLVIKNAIVPEIKCLKDCDEDHYDEEFLKDCHEIVEVASNVKTKEAYYSKNILVLECGEFSGEQKQFENSFSFGQAQKWLNMTIKYLWLLGVWEERFCKTPSVKEQNIPIDSYIIEAVNKRVQVEKDIQKTKPWSKWTESDYVNYREKIKNVMEKYDSDLTPLEWESKIWLEIAKEKAAKRRKEGSYGRQSIYSTENW